MAHLEFDRYGKTKVRLTQVRRVGERHDLREWAVKILLQGDFRSAYVQGDNSAVLPTDTMKNTVYVLARKHGWLALEDFSRRVAEHFLSTLAHAHTVVVEVEEIAWHRLLRHPTAFFHAGSERRLAKLTATRSSETLVCGLTGLQILKTSDSAFAGFLKDEYTTLSESRDRLFGTVLEAFWSYLPVSGGLAQDFDSSHAEVRNALLECFTQHHSESVQHTLFAMGQAVLDQIPAVQDIRIVMPNKHCLLFDLERFGLDNPNEIFVPTDEPSGYIEAKLTR